MNFVDKEDYRSSCKQYFEATHEGITIQSLLDETDTDGGVTPSEHHPNLYFEASEIFWGNKSEKQRGGVGDDAW